MDYKKKLAAQVRQQMQDDGGLLTVDKLSPEGRILAHLHKTGEVEITSESEGHVTYRLVPVLHSYHRRDAVIWTRDNGIECRARVVGVTPKAVRIVTADDGMVRNVDPSTLRYAYDPAANRSMIERLIGKEHGDALDQALVAWLEAKSERSCSTKTKRSYIDTMSSFRTALRIAQLDLNSHPREVALIAKEWAAQRYARPNQRYVEGDASPVTFNQRLSIISSFYKFALRHGLISGENPIDLVERQIISMSDEKPAL